MTREPSGKVLLCILLGNAMPESAFLRESDNRALAIEVSRRFFESPAALRIENSKAGGE